MERKGKQRADGSCQSFEHVLANINKLNRSLEGVVAVSCALSVEVRNVGVERLADREYLGWERVQLCGSTVVSI